MNVEEYYQECTACSGSGYYCCKKCSCCNGTGKTFNTEQYCNDKSDEIQKLCNVTDRDIRRDLYYLVTKIVNDLN